MTVEAWAALALFAFVSSITPGPNNLMLLASGLNFGVRRSFPHMMGVSAGFAVMLIAVGLGLAEIFRLLPQAYLLLRIGGSAYLVYLAYGLLRSGDPGAGESPQAAGPMGFWAIALFQWVNPKAWVMGLTCYAAYVPPKADPGLVVMVAALFSTVNLPCIAAWAGAGARLRRIFADPVKRGRLNLLMAFLLLLSLWPMVSGPAPFGQAP